MPATNREAVIKQLAEDAMHKQSLRRAEIFLDAAIEAVIIDDGVKGAIMRLKFYIEQLQEFERDEGNGG